MNSRSEFRPGSNGLFTTKQVYRSILGEAAFHQMMRLERRRTSRSRKSFALMLLDMGEHAASKSKPSLRKVLSTLSSILRETDVTGWYKEDSVIGVMFTEITLEDKNCVPSTLMSRVTDILRAHLTSSQFRQVSITFHLLSESTNPQPAPSVPLPGVYHTLSSSGRTTETIS